MIRRFLLILVPLFLAGWARIETAQLESR